MVTYEQSKSLEIEKFREEISSLDEKERKKLLRQLRKKLKILSKVGARCVYRYNESGVRGE